MKKNFLFQNLKKDKLDLVDFLISNLHFDKKILIPKDLLLLKIKNGLIKLNERNLKSPPYTISENQTVSVILTIKEIKQFQKKVTPSIELTEKNILYEDEILLLVNKPVGIPTHATLDPERDNLVAAVKRYYKKIKKDVSYLAIHHRLDSETSGVILFCKKQNFNKQISELFSKREIQKTYLAIVQNNHKIPDSWEIKNYLGKVKQTGKKDIIQSVKSGGDFAHTLFSVIGESEDYCLVEAQPQTGRTHQIRVHLFEMGLPILGDPLYHNKDSHLFKRMFLHAFKLNFVHPETFKEIEVKAPAPDLFQEFFDFKID